MRSFKQLGRFCLVGLTCYGVNLLALAVLCEFMGMNYIPAFVIVFVLGNVLGYWLNRRFTFALRQHFDRAALLRYLLVNFAILLASMAALHMLVEWFRIWYLAAVTIVAGINAPISFVAHRVFTYRLAD